MLIANNFFVILLFKNLYTLMKLFLITNRLHNNQFKTKFLLSSCITNNYPPPLLSILQKITFFHFNHNLYRVIPPDCYKKDFLHI
jgi:hypothetical protein